MAEPLRLKLDYAFRDPDLLRQALTHRSFGTPHNERMEFVGDAVLNCVVGVALYERFPALPEGDLSRVRAGLVNGDTLARVARQLGLGQSILLGEGEVKNGGAERSSILADALEALFGAVYLDGGFDAARNVIVTCYASVLRDVDPGALGKDPKTSLQEWLQARRWPVPEYVVTVTSGEPHEQRFTVECRIPRLNIVASGEGSSRRAAEQAAAELAGGLAATAERKGAGGGK
jgi:ribonuclease III